MRAGIPIEEYPVRDKIDANITYTTRYAEIDACITAGLDLSKWDSNIYSREFKAEVMAWHKTSNMIRMNLEDARNAKVKK